MTRQTKPKTWFGKKWSKKNIKILISTIFLKIIIFQNLICPVSGLSFFQFRSNSESSARPISLTLIFMICFLWSTREVPSDPSVTRFGEISPLWCDLIKLWPFWKGSFTIGKILNILWQVSFGFGQMFSIANGQKLNQKI